MSSYPQTIHDGIDRVMRWGSFWHVPSTGPLIIPWDIIRSDDYHSEYQRKNLVIQGEQAYYEKKNLDFLEGTARRALMLYAQYFNIRFVPSKRMGSSRNRYNPQIRFGICKDYMMESFAGHAKLPGHHFGGDVWIEKDYFEQSLKNPDIWQGDTNRTLYHEIGHALGLSHTHFNINDLFYGSFSDVASYFGYLLGLVSRSTFDNGDYSVMSYRCHSYLRSKRRNAGPGIIDLLGLASHYGFNPNFINNEKHAEICCDIAGNSIEAAVNYRRNPNDCVAKRTLMDSTIISPGTHSLSYFSGNGKEEAVTLTTKPFEFYGSSKQPLFTNLSHIKALTSKVNAPVTFKGSPKNETFQGGMGNDRYQGGGGHDTVVIDFTRRGSIGHDVIEDHGGHITLYFKAIHRSELSFFKSDHDLLVCHMSKAPAKQQGQLIHGNLVPEIQGKTVVDLSVKNTIRNFSLHIGYVVVSPPRGNEMSLIVPNPIQQLYLVMPDLGDDDYWLMFSHNNHDHLFEFRHFKKRIRFINSLQRKIKFSWMSKNVIHDLVHQEIISSIRLCNFFKYRSRFKIFDCDNIPIVIHSKSITNRTRILHFKNNSPSHMN